MNPKTRNGKHYDHNQPKWVTIRGNFCLFKTSFLRKYAQCLQISRPSNNGISVRRIKFLSQKISKQNDPKLSRLPTSTTRSPVIFSTPCILSVIMLPGLFYWKSLLHVSEKLFQMSFLVPPCCLSIANQLSTTPVYLIRSFQLTT